MEANKAENVPETTEPINPKWTKENWRSFKWFQLFILVYSWRFLEEAWRKILFAAFVYKDRGAKQKRLMLLMKNSSDDSNSNIQFDEMNFTCGYLQRKFKMVVFINISRRRREIMLFIVNPLYRGFPRTKNFSNSISLIL